MIKHLLILFFYQFKKLMKQTQRILPYCSNFDLMNFLIILNSKKVLFMNLKRVKMLNEHKELKLNGNKVKMLQ